MNSAQMIARADHIDNRLGPISGPIADQLAIDLRATATIQDALIKALENSLGTISLYIKVVGDLPTDGVVMTEVREAIATLELAKAAKRSGGGV